MKIKENIYDGELTIFANISAVVPSLFCLLIFPFEGNPLMDSICQYIIVYLCSFISLIVITSFTNTFLVCLISSGVLLIYIIIGISNKNRLKNLYSKFLTVIGAIFVIDLLTTLLIDINNFFSFYFSIEEIYVSILFLAIGNTIGDYYGSGALAKNGAEIRGAISVYSNQVFNSFFGLFISYFFMSNNSDFDIFLMKKGNSGIVNTYNSHNIQRLIISIFIFAGLIIFFKLSYLNYTQFLVRKPFRIILFMLFAAYLLVIILPNSIYNI